MKFNTLTKSLQILDLFLSANLGENDISRIMKMPRSTAYKYLSILRQYRLLDYDSKSGQYKLGSKFLEFSGAYRSHSKISQVAFPFLKKLYAEVQESVTLDVLSNDEYYTLEAVQKEDGIAFIAMRGYRLPLHCGASGRLLLAFSEKEDIESYLRKGRLKGFTENTMTDKDRLRKKLSEIRQTGYSYSKGEVAAEGWALAAPVFDHLGKICASLCILSTIYRMKKETIEQVRDALIKYAKEITVNLGFVEKD